MEQKEHQTRSYHSLIFKIKILNMIWILLLLLIVVLLIDRPMIFFEGESKVTIPMGSVYQDKKVIARSFFHDKTKKIKVKNDVDTSKPGTYHITYSIPYLNSIIRKKKTIVVVDETKPQIILNGSSRIYIEEGSDYKELGYQALDNNDGDLTKHVQVKSNLDTTRLGEYEINYTVFDKAGNKKTEKRKIVVVEKKDPNLKTVYLTFDDGPSLVTPKILDILKEKGVKATFFMIGKSDDYNDIIKRVYEEGHTVAIHSNTHNYRYIYSSVDTYFKDLYELRERLKSITGSDATIIRFPGGSSNTVSRFNPGVMSTLTSEVLRRGFYYFDWNIDSGDTGRIGSDAIVNNVIEALGNRTTSVVLMHDYGANEQTADALARIIDYGHQNGYRFDRITEATPEVHHGVNN